MKNITEIKPIESEWATINWQVLDWCNYQCSYCNDFNRGGKHKNNNNIEKMIQNVETLISIYKKNNINYFKFAITGGEPSSWKGLIPLIKKFRELAGHSGHLVSLNTNLSRNINWWGSNYFYFDRIIASFHPEFTDASKYLEKYLFLSDKVDVVAKIMMHKNYFNNCIDFANLIKKTCDNYYIEYSPILSTLSPNVDDYTYSDPAHMIFLKNNIFEKKITSRPTINHKINSTVVFGDKTEKKANIQEIVNNKQNNFYNWNCDIYKGIFIDASGDISLATCGQGARIGNIFIENINENFIKSIICKKSWCLCNTDISIPKKLIC
jgi:organic radical activating enzyme